jgi:hypothetical protein
LVLKNEFGKNWDGLRGSIVDLTVTGLHFETGTCILPNTNEGCPNCDLRLPRNRTAKKVPHLLEHNKRPNSEWLNSDERNYTSFLQI